MTDKKGEATETHNKSPDQGQSAVTDSVEAMKTLSTDPIPSSAGDAGPADSLDAVAQSMKEAEAAVEDAVRNMASLPGPPG